MFFQIMIDQRITKKNKRTKKNKQHVDFFKIIISKKSMFFQNKMKKKRNVNNAFS